MLDLKELRKKNSMTQKAAAEYFGCKQSFISQIESGSRRIPKEFIQKIVKDPSIIVPEEVRELQVETSHQLAKTIGVPYFDIDISASIKESFSDIKEIPEFLVDFKPFNDCTAYLPIWGDSMHPLYSSGEIIAIKELNNPDIILWGEAYLIITNEEANNMKTIKLLYPHDEPDKVILRAANVNFKGDTVIAKSSILNLYAIKGKITRKQL